MDRSQLRAGVPILVAVTLHPNDLAEVRDSVMDAEAVEHVFTTAESDLVFHARVRADSIQEWITQGDAQSLPYLDNTFDAAYLVITLGEIPNQQVHCENYIASSNQADD